MADTLKAQRGANKANVPISLMKDREGNIDIRSSLAHAFLTFLEYKIQGGMMEDKTGEELRCQVKGDLHTKVRIWTITHLELNRVLSQGLHVRVVPLDLCIRLIILAAVWNT